MNIEVKVNEHTAGVIRQIAKLKDCSIEMATRIVLERYSDKALSQIERAYRAADISLRR